MGEIVDLAFQRGQKTGALRPAMTHGPAQVVLYTGVRYERADPYPPEPPTDNKPRAKRKKRKLS